MTDGLAARTWADLRSHWRSALAFHVVMQLLGAAIFTPLIAGILGRLVAASGEPVVSNYDIAAFVLSPLGAATVVLVVALSISLLLAEFLGLSYLSEHAMSRRRASVTATIAFVLKRMPQLAFLSARVFVRLLLLALPFLAVAGVVWFTTLAGQDINYYLTEEPPAWRRAMLVFIVLGAGYGLLAAWQLTRWIYALPVMVAERAGPNEALATSALMTRGRVLRIALTLILWWLAITAVTIAITWLCRQVTDVALDWAGIDVRRVLPLVAVFLVASIAGGLLYGSLYLAGHQFLVTRMHAEQAAHAHRPAPALEEADEGRAHLAARPAIAATLLLFVLSLGSAAFLGRRLDLVGEAEITAHRGAKAVAPENSMAAFQAAIDAGATYAELDVQHTKDRQLIVMHDADFMRMAGDPRKVAELTAAEIASIDIGRKTGPQFAGQHAPLLAEVFDLARGRMKINIELKYNVPDPGLAPAVVEYLRRENLIDQAVITSLDYGALKQVESLEPRIRTGHIVTAAVGDVLRTSADFLSLNAAQATSSLIRRARAAGKDVAVWTVNDPESMLRMIERGADNIITDDPGLLVRVMQERGALGKAEILGLRLRVLFDKAPRGVTDPEAVEAL